MDKLQVSIKFSLVVFILISPITLSIASDQLVENNDEDSILNKVYTSWDKVKNLAQEAQKKIRTPNEIEEMAEEVAAKVDSEQTTEKIKDALKRSLEDGEATLDKAAESAATVVDDAVNKAKDAKEKVEEKISEETGHNVEL